MNIILETSATQRIKIPTGFFKTKEMPIQTGKVKIVNSFSFIKEYRYIFLFVK